MHQREGKPSVAFSRILAEGSKWGISYPVPGAVAVGAGGARSWSFGVEALEGGGAVRSRRRPEGASPAVSVPAAGSGACLPQQVEHRHLELPIGNCFSRFQSARASPVGPAVVPEAAAGSGAANTQPE